MNEMVGIAGGKSGLVESSDSGQVAFASALDSAQANTPYRLGAGGERPPISREAAT